MRPSLRSALFLTMILVSLSFLGFRLSAFGFAAERASAKVERGMTAEQVQGRLGAPKRIARQIIYHRHLEQWVYDSPDSARLAFDCPRGQMPQLIWKQGFPAEKVEREPSQKPN